MRTVRSMTYNADSDHECQTDFSCKIGVCTKCVHLSSLFVQSPTNSACPICTAEVYHLATRERNSV